GLSLRAIHSGYVELALARRGRPARRAAAPRPAAEVWRNSRRLTRILGLLLRELEAESTPCDRADRTGQVLRPVTGGGLCLVTRTMSSPYGCRAASVAPDAIAARVRGAAVAIIHDPVRRGMGAERAQRLV